MTITLKQFWTMTDSPIVVLEETNGKVLSMSYNPERYPGLGSRPVLRFFAKDQHNVGLKSEWDHNVIHAVVGV